ncbi:unnamed protein product, partial [Cyprideis torosa]
MIKYLMNGVGTAANGGFIPKGLPGYQPNIGYGFQPDKALELIKSYKKEKGNMPPITLQIVSEYADLAEFIQAQCAKVGLNIKFEEDLDQVIAAAMKEGVEQFVLPAIDSAYHHAMWELKNKFPERIHLMIGLHPTHVKPESMKEELQKVEEELATGKYVAVDRLVMEKKQCCRQLMELYPNETIISCSTAGDIIDDEVLEGHATSVVVEFEKSNFETKEAESAQRPSFSPSDAVYLITPDRFANGNPKNDINPKARERKLDRSNPGGRHGGDIQGIINHLDYVSDLGFTFIWPTPMIENDMEAYSYHGYAATDFYQIDARYGTNEEYKKMVKAAKEKGLGVIKDVVLNHIGSEHWFFKDPPYKDWINEVYPGKFTQTSHIKMAEVSPYATEIDQKEYTDGWFVDTMPDLNQRNPQMAKYLIQNSIWWVEYAGIRGIRVDTYSYSDKDFLTQWTKALTTEYPNLNIVGEEWINIAPYVAYWQAGKDNFDGYTQEEIERYIHIAQQAIAPNGYLILGLGYEKLGSNPNWL